jgi:hypothetical protein
MCYKTTIKFSTRGLFKKVVVSLKAVNIPFKKSMKHLLVTTSSFKCTNEWCSKYCDSKSDGRKFDAACDENQTCKCQYARQTFIKASGGPDRQVGSGMFFDWHKIEVFLRCGKSEYGSVFVPKEGLEAVKFFDTKHSYLDQLLIRCFKISV